MAARPRTIVHDAKALDEERWRRLTLGHFDLYPVDGTHLSIVRTADAFQRIGRHLAERVAFLREGYQHW